MPQEGPRLKNRGRASAATRIAVLTWRSLLIMSREWRYFWIRLVLYVLLTVSIGTVFFNVGHSLLSVMVSTCVFSFQALISSTAANFLRTVNYIYIYIWLLPCPSSFTSYLLPMQVRVASIFVFVSFMLLLSVSGLPAHINEIKVNPFLLRFVWRYVKRCFPSYNPMTIVYHKVGFMDFFFFFLIPNQTHFVSSFDDSAKSQGHPNFL